MFLIGVAAAVMGIVLFQVALGRTIRANARSRIPFGRSPRISPRGAVAMRAIGAGLIVLGAVLVSTAGWQWPLMVMLAGPVAALAVLSLHNRRAGREAS
jgi:hypothetical protein